MTGAGAAGGPLGMGATAVGLGGTGPRVMVVGTAVTMPGLVGTKAAQMPVK